MSQAPQHSYRQLRDEADRRRVEWTASTLPKIHIAMATCGIAAGAQETRAAFEEATSSSEIAAQITLGLKCMFFPDSPIGRLVAAQAPSSVGRTDARFVIGDAMHALFHGRTSRSGRSATECVSA